MARLTIFVVFCLHLATIRQSEAACQEGGNTFEVGAVWSAKGQCQGYTCTEDGTYKAKLCDPVPEDLPEGWTVKPGAADAPFPECCAQAIESVYNYSLPGCTVDKKTVKVGEQYDLPGTCHVNICKGNDEWVLGACGLIGVADGQVATAVDVSKPYPDCCGDVVPHMDIVPDVVDNLEMSLLLELRYGKVNVTPGLELTPTQVKDQPAVNYTADPESWYLLCMTDPDAPSRKEPTLREVQHWMVGNIPGNKVSEGEVLTEYVGSGPPKGSGLHRYVFLVYKQPGKITFDEARVDNTSFPPRKIFSIRKFAQKYKLGDPVAFNVYQAQYDDYVPILHKQLGKKD